jgi:hypothetical protein
MGHLRKACVAVCLPWLIGIGVWAASTSSSYLAGACTFLTVISTMYLFDI